MLNFQTLNKTMFFSKVALTSYVSKKQPWARPVGGDELPWHMLGSVATREPSVM